MAKIVIFSVSQLLRLSQAKFQVIWSLLESMRLINMCGL